MRIYFFSQLFLLLSACASNHVSQQQLNSNIFYRGSAALYDPGPSKDSKWVKLFATLPDYRGLAKNVSNVTSDEVYHWDFGPTLYRGRLKNNEVKIFITGIDQTQDNISHRAFTGKLGNQLQDFLNHLGIRYSYLFLNSSAFLVRSEWQLNPKYRWLADNLDSPLVIFRNKLFDHIAETNPDSLAVLMGVGREGKNAISAWINSHHGKCSPIENLTHCDASAIEKKFKLKKKIFVIGIPEPSENLVDSAAGLKIALHQLVSHIGQNKDWLPQDWEKIYYKEDEAKVVSARQNFAEYKVSEHAIPHWDFSFGANWRLGASSEQMKQINENTIILSDSDKTIDSVTTPAENTTDIDPLHPIPEIEQTGEQAYTWPQTVNGSNFFDSYDYGPCANSNYSCPLAELLMGEKHGYPWSSKETFDLLNGFGFAGFYRGRLDQAEVLVLADHDSPDELLSARALTGDAGQKLQSFLFSMGITKSYAILRTLPLAALDESDEYKFANTKQAAKTRNKILESIIEQSKTKIVLCLGPSAEKMWRTSGIQMHWFGLEYPKNKNHVEQWNRVLVQLSQEKYRHDVNANFKYSGKNSTIPRQDMPYHTPWWVGSSGNRVLRIDDHSFVVRSPSWLDHIKPKTNNR